MKFKTKMELVAAKVFSTEAYKKRFCLKNALTRAKKHVKMAKNSVCDAKSPKVINAKTKFETPLGTPSVKKPILAPKFVALLLRKRTRQLENNL